MASIYDKSSLVLIPSGTKTGKVYSQVPTNGDGDFTFTRSSAATRVNADGNIEKETGNLLLQSNTFNIGYVLEGSATITGNQAGYDGTNNAWLLSKNSDWSHIYQNISQSGVWTASIYAKAGTTNWVALENSGIAGDTCYFDLSSGVTGSTGSGVIGSSIQDIGNGWYRCSVTINGTSIRQRIYPAFSNGNINGGNGNIYIQDAQLEQGLVARDVLTTTTSAVYGGITDNVPRLDYTDSSCPALLLEPLRTNVITHSEYIASWSTPTSAQMESNSIVSPEGVQNATKLIKTISSSSWIRQLPSVTIGQKQVISCFAKAGNNDIFNITYYDVTDGDRFFNYDLSDETISGNGLSHATYVDSGIEDYGNGWYRCYVIVTAGNATPQVQIAVGVNRTGPANDYIYVWGAQHEQNASYITSYIPTYGSSVSRVYENQDVTGLFANVFNNDNLTLFYDFNYNAEGREGSTTAYRIFSGSSQLGIKGTNNTNRTLNIFSSGDFSGSINFNGENATRIKVALRITNGTCELFFNGAKDTETIDVSGAAPYTWGQITMLASNSFNTSLNQCLGFPTALTDQEAIDLTTI